jgi:hypothetical protein
VATEGRGQSREALVSKSIEMQALRGRKIVTIRLNPFRRRPDETDPFTGKAMPSIDKGMTYNPVICLDDGTSLTFEVEETDVGVYGIVPVHRNGWKWK